MSVWTPPTTDADQLAWMRLIRSENVGPATFGTLMRRFQGAEAALKALPDLARRGGLKRKIKLAAADEVAREMEAVHKVGASLIFLGAEAYPPLLATIDQPPPVLTGGGRPHS
jgi:DNA processing protein